MIRRLRLRLTVICTVLTGAVLVAMTAAVVRLSEREYRALSQSVFRDLTRQMTELLLTETEITHQKLAQMESANRLVISVEDNGTPIFFSGSWLPRTDRATLLSRARAAREGLDAPASGALTSQRIFTLTGDHGDRYRAAVVRVGLPGRGYVLTMLSDQTAEDARVLRQKADSLAVCAAGLTLLALASFILSGVAARPVRRAMERQNAFIAAASHELRSPLAAMGASASAILIDQGGAPAYVRAITGECARMGRLVDDLLLLASAATPAWKLHSAPVALDTLLIETVEQLAPLCRENGHRLTLSLSGEEDLPLVLGDAARIRQAVGNLVVNAACYAGGSGPIEVSARAAGRAAEIRVADHGAGIPDKDKARVFERFFRADRARSDKAHFGLGLSIAREIARLHGGKLALRDTSGGGCTFILCLPAAPTVYKRTN